MRKDHGKVFDVESTQKDQVYLGLDQADSQAEKLVAKTKGLVLSTDGIAKIQPLKAFYHSSCGGSTILPQDVWGKGFFAGFKKRSNCGFCKGAPGYDWDYQLSYAEIQKRVLRNWMSIERSDTGSALGLNRQSVSALNKLMRNPDGWVLMNVQGVPVMPSLDPSLKPQLKFQPKKNLMSAFVSTAQAEQAPVPLRMKDFVFEFMNPDQGAQRIKIQWDAYQVRNWLDPARLKSTWFQLKQIGRSVVFVGRGAGHGVGLCQWGAKKMGELGYSRDRILSQYYPGSKIKKVW
jgi:stage II sporulation protein D